MKSKDFLLEGGCAKKLYHDFAFEMPIIDYHSHIIPGEICENRRFSDLTEVWLGADHYKWRLMRSCGINEDYITGSASPWEKFKAFAGVLPRCIGNPVYHWAHLELQRFFGCDIPLSADTAGAVWEMTLDRLSKDDKLRPQGIIKQMKVEVVVTTDDPVDSLEWHQKLAADDSFDVKVLPCFRPDAAISIDTDGFVSYINSLAEASDTNINDFDSLRSALCKRLSYFDKLGCRAGDHGLSSVVFAPCSDNQANTVLKKALCREAISTNDADMFKFAVLSFLAGEYKKLGWVMELHLGVSRNVNSRMLGRLGANTGFDCINPVSCISDLARVLDSFDCAGNLPKTLIFSANPNDNAAINTIAGCFNQEGIFGKVQQGSAWWFNDTYGGMTQQLTSFAEYGVLSNFVGMLTDSRSFMSYTRHEYFRRILCNLIGGFVDSGKFPDDYDFLGNVIKDICYFNSKKYFEF